MWFQPPYDHTEDCWGLHKSGRPHSKIDPWTVAALPIDSWAPLIYGEMYLEKSSISLANFHSLHERHLEVASPRIIWRQSSKGSNQIKVLPDNLLCCVWLIPLFSFTGKGTRDRCRKRSEQGGHTCRWAAGVFSTVRDDTVQGPSALSTAGAVHRLILTSSCHPILLMWTSRQLVIRLCHNMFLSASILKLHMIKSFC